VVLTGTSNFAAGTVLGMTDNTLISFKQTVTLDNLTVNMTGSTSASYLYADGAGTVMTLGPNFTLRANSPHLFNEISTGEYATGAVTLRNRGLIENVGSGRLGVSYRETSPLTFVNQSGGILRATAGTFQFGGQTFTNEAGGLIEAAGGTVWVAGNWSNAGTIRVTSGTLKLGGAFTTAGLGTVERPGGAGTIEIVGTMDNTGATFGLSTVSGSYGLVNGAEIKGGSIAATGTGRLLARGGILTDVAVGQGVLDFTGYGSSLLLRGTSSLTPGDAIDLIDSVNALGFQRTVTLDNMTFRLDYSSRLTAEGANTVTLGPNTTVMMAGSRDAFLSSDYLFNGGLNLVGAFRNQGMIQADIGKLWIHSDAFTNDGTLLANGGQITVTANSYASKPLDFTNFNAGTLTGGTYIVRNGGTLDLGGRAVTTVAAGTTVELNGAASTFAALNTLETNAGTLRILGGKNFDPAGSVLNTGTVVVGPGSTLSSNLNVSGGTVRGAGTIAGNLIIGTAGGTLAPGSETDGSTGALAVGPLRLSAASIFEVDLNGTTPGTGHDRLTVTGPVELLGGTLKLKLGGGYAPADGDRLMIIDNDGIDLVTGTFAGLEQGAAFPLGDRTAYIDYRGGTGNDVVIQFTPVPEPAGIVAFAGLVAAVAGYRRRR
jgi:hypothetical protein